MTSPAGRTTAIPDLVEIELARSNDARGSFTKLFHRSQFDALGAGLDVREQFVSTSVRGVIRGLHFQLPPRDLAKLVVCLDGRIVDVVVDLRRDSPAFRQSVVFTLDAADARAVWVPHGCAHGFCVMSEQALVAYSTDQEYDADLDAGILWSSVGIEWPVTDPILSDRDAAFPTLADFESPFSLPTSVER